MADAGFFKGTSAEQDSRFANKQKKLLKQMKFPDNVDVKIDMLKINLDVLKPWITKRLQELLGIEDDVVIEFVFNQLEDKNPDPKMMQINLTGFLGGSKARLFISELWKLLSSAQSSPDGIPAELVEMKKQELLKRQIEDDRLREIRKREEDSQRQDIKLMIEKSDGRNLISTSNNKSRNENGNSGGYKSRGYYDRDRRRSPPKTRRTRDSHSPELKSRRTEKKTTRSVSKSSESDKDRYHHQEKSIKSLKSSSNRHREPSKSPTHNRSPIKSLRKTEKHQQRSSSSSSSSKIINALPKPKTRPPSSSPNVDRSHKKLDKPSRKKPSKRTRSNSSSSRSSLSELESKKSKKSKKKLQLAKNHSSKSRSRSSSPVRNKKKDDHKSKKHHRSNHTKEKSHRDYPDKSSKTKKNHRNESSKKKSSNLSDNEILQTPSSPKKLRLESEIRVQTPPPPPPLPPPPPEPKIQPNRTERIVLLEDSRSISTRVSITTQPISNNNEEQPKINNNTTSEDENEIDLRERLLREKAIKSMKRRQLSTNNNDRIIYETQ